MGRIQITISPKAKRWIEGALAAAPVFAYFIDLLLLFPANQNSVRLQNPHFLFVSAAWFAVIGTTVLLISKRAKEEYFISWLSFSLFFSLSHFITVCKVFRPINVFICGEFNNEYFGILNERNALIVAIISALLLFCLRRKVGEKRNRLLLPAFVFFFAFTHYIAGSCDYLSFGGVHVDFYDPFPWILRMMATVSILLTVYIFSLFLVQRRSKRIIITILFFVCHFLAVNQSRIASIFYYSKALSLRQSALFHILGLIGPYVGLYFIKSGFFLFLLPLLPVRKRVLIAHRPDGKSPESKYPD